MTILRVIGQEMGASGQQSLQLRCGGVGNGDVGMFSVI